MKRLLSITLLLASATTASAMKIQPKSVGPMQRLAGECGSYTCDRYQPYRLRWAVYHPAKLSAESSGSRGLDASWVVKRDRRKCCYQVQYDAYSVAGDRAEYAATADRYRVRDDSPRIPPVLPAYWADGRVPAWLIAGEYFYFVRIDHADATQRSSWWISPDGENWKLLEGEAIVADPARQQTLGGAPELPLPPVGLGG